MLRLYNLSAENHIVSIMAKNNCIHLITVLLILLLSAGCADSAESPGLQAAQSNPIYLPFLPFTTAPTWIGPDGGLISAIAISPLNPQITYAGSWGGGVYRSADGGATWTWKSRGLGSLTVVSLAVDPSDPQVVYAGTYRGGIYKSADGGENWQPANQGIQALAIVYSIVIDPHSPQTVFAATRGPSNNGNPPWAGVVYRSSDGGQSWPVSLANLGGKSYQDWVYSLAISRSNPSVLMAATHEHGPLRSTNSGGSWQQVISGITNKSTRAIAIGPTNASSQTAYTGVWTKTGVFKSTDLGDNWNLKASGVSGANIYNMDIDPFNPQNLYLATYNMGVVKSGNGANGWFISGLSNEPITSVRVDPGSGSRIFAGGAGGGLFLSPDGGASWQYSQAGLKASSATGLVVSPSDPALLYAGVDGSGVLRSTDGGQTWSDYSQGLGSRLVNALVQQPGSAVMYALTDGGGLFRCDPSGACWQRVGGNIPAAITLDAQGAPSHPYQPGSSFEDAYPPDEFLPEAVPGNYGLLAMAFAPSNSNLAYLGTYGAGAWKSTDGGLNWSPAGLSGEVMWALAVEPGNPQVVYAALEQPGAVKISLNGGANWADLPLVGLTAYALAVSPANPGAPLAGTSSGVWIWQAGAWQPLGLAGSTITALAFSPVDPLFLAAGSTDGAFMSYDGGLTWQPAADELAGHTVQAIVFDPANPGVIYFATTGHGVLRMTAN